MHPVNKIQCLKRNPRPLCCTNKTKVLLSRERLFVRGARNHEIKATLCFFSDLKVQMLEFGMENSFQLLLLLIVKDSEEMEKASMEGKRKGDGG